MKPGKDLKNAQPQEDARINVEEREDVRRWCKKLGCNEARLRNAILAVGPSTEAVKEYMTKTFL